ncbi:PHB depolymerase family esterase [Rhizobium sp. CCGE531]|uniref:extracellular catalytic domain type 2 short-chain-length polyhydroxyalkanoate depolymerase n=1 Tax=Rhizobium sp. CCGE531 TaxID=2364271 RepID=UPI000EAA44DE|nr:PHB depolymerase family esterase [Rhizobium sp. CCGE531]AYG70687.1 depolymerase [Rhizobium sp. CCGE531]
MSAKIFPDWKKTRFCSLVKRIVTASFSLLLLTGVAQTQALPKLKIDRNAISVSGLSSGAFMASQLQVAYSSSFMGAGIVAGGPYFCAMGNLTYTGICMGQVPRVPPNPAMLFAAAETSSRIGAIDPLSNLESKKIYIFSGTADTIVKQSAVDASVQFFKLARVPDSNLAYVSNYPAGHSFVSKVFGNLCPTNATPYINECVNDPPNTANDNNYDQAGAILQFIYGKLNQPAAKPTGKLRAFDQKLYGAANPVSSMADVGHVFIPDSCGKPRANCKLHVSIHGCRQSQQSIGDDWYTKLYLNNWADTNGIIVLYPQVNKSFRRPYNPRGCWDWWGFTGSNYAIKGAVQMDAIMKMIAALGAL